MSTDTQARSTDAFTLPELLVGILVFGTVLMLVLGVLMAARRALPGRELQVDGQSLPIAPSPGAFAEAVRLHSQFIERIGIARAVYVFGGTHAGLPKGATRLGLKPLAGAALPVLAFPSPEDLPPDVGEFYQRHKAALGPMVEQSHPDDFSVVVVGPENGQLVVIALIQVRTQAVAVGGQQGGELFTRRDINLFDVSAGGASYRYLERNPVAGISAVGATHFWHRYDDSARVYEEGPALTVFPDPWLYAGARRDSQQSSDSKGAEIPPYSRFAYILAVSP